MKHNKDGLKAEKKVAEYLEQNGFKILDQNWKTPKCEIDIVARKDKCVYFVEVKYRSSSSQGDGLEYVTSAKQKQMSYAAEIWVSHNKWRDEYVLSAASVSGPSFEIEFIEEI